MTRLSRSEQGSINRLVAAFVLMGSLGMAFSQPYHPAVDAFFNSNDAFVKGTIIPNIEKNRKSNAQIAFSDKDGNPLTGLEVSVKQIEHSFHWGAVPPFERALYGTPDIIKLWRDIYNYGITEFSFKWANVEKVKGAYDWTAADKVLETFRASGAELEYHFLTGYHPVWLDSLPTAERAPLQRAFALAALERYKDKIRNYQVYNESHYSDGGPFNPIPRASVYFNKATFFKEVSAKYPTLTLGINDCFRWHIKTLPSPADAKTLYPGIKFVGQHGHNPHTYWVTPKEIYGHYDPYTGSGVKIHIEEFGAMEGAIQGGNTGTWNEDLKTEYFISTYATIFSHPAVGAFNQWGIGPDTNRWTINYLLDGTGKPKPSYAAMKSLVRDKFMTRTSGPVDGTGLYKYRGFRGTYEVTVKKGALQGMAQVTLGDVDANLKLKVLDATGGLVIEGGDPVTFAPLQLQPRFKGPDIDAPAGMPVQFAGLRDVRTLEIRDLRGTLVREWDVIGDRILWNRDDARGQAVPRGTYVVRTLSIAGEAHSRTMNLR